MCVKWQGREWEKPIPKLWELEGNEKSQQSGTGRESKRSNTKIPTKGSRRESSSWCSSKNFTLSRYDPPSRHNHYLLFGRTHHFHFPPDLKLILHHFKKFCLATASEKERHNETGHAPQSTSLGKDVTIEEVQGDKKDGGGVEVACARHGESVLLPRLEEP